MKLYYAPGACSLASRISLHEAGIAADFERVDMKTKITEHGFDYNAINPKSYVPMLVLDDGAAITENVAILELIADREPKLAPGGPLGRTRLIEMLSFLSSELHVAFKPFFHGASDEGKAVAGEAVVKRLDLIEQHIRELYLFGPRFTVADAYLFVILRWAKAFGLRVSTEMLGYFERVAERSTVRQALAEEGSPERGQASPISGLIRQAGEAAGSADPRPRRYLPRRTLDDFLQSWDDHAGPPPRAYP